MRKAIVFVVILSVFHSIFCGFPTPGAPYDAAIAVVDLQTSTPYPLHSIYAFTVSGTAQSAGNHSTTFAAMQKQETLVSFGNNTYYYQVDIFTTALSDVMPTPLQIPPMTLPSNVLAFGIGVLGGGIPWSSTLGAINVRSSGISYYNDTGGVVLTASNSATSTSSTLFCRGGAANANALRIYKVSCAFLLDEIAVTTGAVTSSPLTTSPLTSAELTTSPTPVTSGSVTSGAITSSDVTSGAVTSAAVTSSAVTSARSTTGPIFTTGTVSITSAAMTTSPVTTSEMTTNPVTSSEVTSADITSGVVVAATTAIVAATSADSGAVTSTGDNGDRSKDSTGPLVAAIVVPIAVALLIVVFIVVLISVKRSKQLKNKDIEMNPKKQTSTNALVKNPKKDKSSSSESESGSEESSEGSSKSGSSKKSASETGSESESGSESSSSGDSKATSGSEVSADKARKK